MATRNTRIAILPHFLLIAVLLVSVFGCATLPKTEADSERAIDFTPQWQLLDAEVDGVDVISGKLPEQKLNFYALRVDLGNKNLKIVLNEPQNPIPAIKVSTFVRKYQLLAGINASPFDKVSAIEGEPRINAGIFVSSGVPVFPPRKNSDISDASRYNYGALVFWKDGYTEILEQDEIRKSDYEKYIENALGGFRIIIKDGANIAPRGNFEATQRAPRSAVGLSPGARYLFLVAIDGRSRISAGATEFQTSEILLALGASDALNLDGGGSTALAVNDNGRIRVLNTPIHAGIAGKERAVSVCIGVQVVQ
jgi:exopolysaccharide biosynthesis protein